MCYILVIEVQEQYSSNNHWSYYGTRNDLASCYPYRDQLWNIRWPDISWSSTRTPILARNPSYATSAARASIEALTSTSTVVFMPLVPFPVHTVADCMVVHVLTLACTRGHRHLCQIDNGWRCITCNTKDLVIRVLVASAFMNSWSYGTTRV